MKSFGMLSRLSRALSVILFRVHSLEWMRRSCRRISNVSSTPFMQSTVVSAINKCMFFNFFSLCGSSYRLVGLFKAVQCPESIWVDGSHISAGMCILIASTWINAKKPTNSIFFFIREKQTFSKRRCRNTNSQVSWPVNRVLRQPFLPMKIFKESTRSCFYFFFKIVFFFKRLSKSQGCCMFLTTNFKRTTRFASNQAQVSRIRRRRRRMATWAAHQGWHAQFYQGANVCLSLCIRQGNCKWYIE